MSAYEVVEATGPGTPRELPGITDVLHALGEPALVTGEWHEVRAYNEPAGRLLGLDEGQGTCALVDRLRPLARSGDSGPHALAECLSACEGESLIPIRLLVDGSPVTGTWSVVPVGAATAGRGFHLHRFYAQEPDKMDTSRVDFLANVSHELRTPLSALVATTEVMLQDCGTIPAEELGKMIGLLHRNTRRLEALVSNLIDAAGLQNGKLQLRRSPANAHSLVRDATDFVQPLLSAKNQKLDVRQIGHVPALLVDAKRIVGVLVNLLSNASRYGPPNEPVQLLVAGEGTLVRFTVRQRGPGIPKHEQPLLFQRFYRASTGEMVQGGSGLGLAIVKDIVEMHGGMVGVASKPGTSTAFWFTLPLEGAGA